MSSCPAGRAACALPSVSHSAWPALTVILLVVAYPAHTQAPATAMQVRIDGMGGDASALTLVYSNDPGVEAAGRDIEALAQAAGWDISGADPVEGEAGTYSAEITPAVTPELEGGAPLFPILRAFDRYGALEITFVGLPTGDTGDYEGENPYIAARWSRRNNVTKYSVRVKDNSYGSAADIELPDVAAADAELAPLADESPEVAPQATVRSAPRRRGGSSAGGLWVLVVLGSLGAGIFTWGLTWWLIAVRQARIGDASKEGKPSPGSKHTEPSAHTDDTGGGDVAV